MHADIKRVTGTLHRTQPLNISIDFDSAQNSPMGRLLHILYYKMHYDLLDLLPRGSHFGYPNNGGTHGFGYLGPGREFVAWLELFKEELEKYTLSPEERQVANELSFISQDILGLLTGRSKLY